MSFLSRCLRCCFVALLAVPLAAAASCSEPDGPPLPELTEEQFLQQLSSLVCQRRAACSCPTNSIPAGISAGPSCEPGMLELYRAAGRGLTFDGTCAALFIDEYRSVNPCSLGPNQVFASTRCAVGCSVYSGKLKAGEACQQPAGDANLESMATPCEGTLRCLYSGSAGQVCSPGCPNEEGAPCGFEPATGRSLGGCRSGLDCRSPGNTGPGGQVCVARGAQGESCSSRGCREGTFCGCPGGDPFNCASTSLVCLPYPAQGQPCPQGLCSDRSLFCDATPPASPPPEGFTPTCKARWADGVGCSAFEQCQSGFCPDGVCRPIPGPGEPCPGGLCGEGYECKGGVCAGAPGGVCYSN